MSSPVYRDTSLLLDFVEDRYHVGINAEAINNEVDSSFSICTVLVMVRWGKYTAGGCIQGLSSQPMVSVLLSGDVWNVLSDNFWTNQQMWSWTNYLKIDLNSYNLILHHTVFNQSVQLVNPSPQVIQDAWWTWSRWSHATRRSSIKGAEQAAPSQC
jgi:hypothetical protein